MLLSAWAVEANKASAAALHAHQRMRDCEPDDYARWSKLLLRVLDHTVFDQLGAPHGSAIRELRARCNELLGCDATAR